jgi:ABC-2 type transport system permease protein
VSAWAPRAPFFWAVLPPFAIAGLERIVFHTWYFGNLLWGRFIGDTSTASVEQHADLFPTNPMLHTTPATFLSSPGLWIGVLIAAAFLVAAIQFVVRSDSWYLTVRFEPGPGTGDVCLDDAVLGRSTSNQ